MAKRQFTHLEKSGNVRMVDVSSKPITQRTAIAEGYVLISDAVATAIAENSLQKGEALTTARLAGIMAAKRTAEIIPLCHNIPLDHVKVNIDLIPVPERISTSVKGLTGTGQCLHIVANCQSSAATGVEMEALVAISATALTIYDMAKAVDKGMQITGIRLLEKQGGRSGIYRADMAVSK